MVSTISVAMPWASLSDGPLDFAHVDIAMGHVDFETIARGAGLQRVHTISEANAFDAMVPLHFEEEGPAVFIWKIAPGNEPVPKPALPIRERAARLRRALITSQD